MESQTGILILILGMAAVTALCRLTPFAVIGSRRMPDLVQLWLKQVPCAVFAAMVLPQVLLKDDRVDLSLSNLYLWVSIGVVLVVLRTKSLGLSVIAGMVGLAVWRHFS